MKNPIEQIELILSKLESRSEIQFEYALYLTLSLTEICELFFEYVLNTKIRDNLTKQINLRVERRGEVIPNSFIDKLVYEFTHSDKKYRRSLGKVIGDLQGSLTEEQMYFLVKTQIASDKVSERKRAYVLCESIYNKNIDDMLWSTWRKYGDENCLSLLAKHAKSKDLSNNFSEIWKHDCKFRIKNDILKRVAAHDFDRTGFLKVSEPIPYLTACVAAQKQVEDSFLWSIIERLDTINSFGYVLWCFGMLGKRDFLWAVLEKVDEIESKLPIETWEPEFYGF